MSRDGEKFVLAVPRPQLRQLTVYDRSGKAVNTVPQAGFYNQPHLSPDGDARGGDAQRPADRQRRHLGGGAGHRQGHPDHQRHVPRERADLVARRQAGGLRVHPRGHLAGIYRKNADGTGEAELVFQYTPGAGMVLTDWSSDNKYMTFFTGVVVLVPISGNAKAAERKEIDWLREDYDAGAGPVLA